MFKSHHIMHHCKTERSGKNKAFLFFLLCLQISTERNIHIYIYMYYDQTLTRSSKYLEDPTSPSSEQLLKIYFYYPLMHFFTFGCVRAYRKCLFRSVSNTFDKAFYHFHKTYIKDIWQGPKYAPISKVISQNQIYLGMLELALHLHIFIPWELYKKKEIISNLIIIF